MSHAWGTDAIGREPWRCVLCGAYGGIGPEAIESAAPCKGEEIVDIGWITFIGGTPRRIILKVKVVETEEPK